MDVIVVADSRARVVGIAVRITSDEGARQQQHREAGEDGSGHVVHSVTVGEYPPPPKRSELDESPRRLG
jgi:hypothetical protein